MTVGAVDDPMESEADLVARRIVRGSMEPAGAELSPVRRFPAKPAPMQRKQSNGHVATAPRGVARTVASPGPGAPVGNDIRERVEPVLDADLSAVRVHDDQRSRQAAAGINARAFTYGNDVFLGDGESQGDLGLMAHELTHTVQQSGISAGNHHGAGRDPALARLPDLGIADFLEEQAGEALEAGAEFLGVDPDIFSAFDASLLLGGPVDKLIAVKRLLQNPLVREALMSQLGEYAEQMGRVLELDEETLLLIQQFLDDPEGKTLELLDQLQPYIDQVPGVAEAEARRLLAEAGLATAPVMRVLAEIHTQLLGMASEWRQVVYAMVVDTFVIWDWSNQVQEFEDLNTRFSSELIDTFDWWVGMVRIVLGGLDRILGFIDMVAFVVSFVGGTSAGTAVGAGGGAVAGAGVGAAPGAAAGGGTGAAAGGGVAATIHAGLGVASLAGSISVEIVAILKAAYDLAEAEQNDEQEDEDYRQIASSIIALALMLALFLLGALASRIAKTLSARLKRLGRARTDAARVGMTEVGQTQHFHDLPSDRLPRNMPEGHFWHRNEDGQWVLMRESGAQPVDLELIVYSDGAGNINYVLRSGDRMIESNAITRQGGTYARGQQRLPEDLRDVGEANPYRDPVTGELYDKGHGVDYADTLEGSGVRSSTTDVANFTPQQSWWNRGPRNTLVNRIRNGHAATGRPGGGGYREMAIYPDNPRVTADGTPIPSEFVFVETDRAGVPQNAWRIPNEPGAGTRSISSIDQHAISLGEVPSLMLRDDLPLQPPSTGMSYARSVVFGMRGAGEINRVNQRLATGATENSEEE